MMCMKSLKVFLFLSLVLNAFLVGNMATSLAVENLKDNMNPIMRFESAVEDLPPEYQEEIRTMWAEHRQDMKEHIYGMFSSMQDVRAILTAKDLDIEAFKDLHAKMQQDDDVMKERMSTMAIEISSQLPDEARIQFFETAIPDEMPMIMKIHLNKN